ncbi:hypothetical protein BESB_004690 [Besnoitia besnoiti]|uniref:Transmembrane protein n=1 Tax=Besnoitia besnoiti TaxID=94643 RepID=A0A2A9MHV9_BESBE|nr:hypothetical protein BESB_004690 [Besnoitia besnoiti]PFH38128.1 hypothetical protein BESB_004690 [Besnoitia besnoiti]
MRFTAGHPFMLSLSAFAVASFVHAIDSPAGDATGRASMDATTAPTAEVVVSGLRSLELFDPSESYSKDSADVPGAFLSLATASELGPSFSKTWARYPSVAFVPPVDIGGAPLPSSLRAVDDPVDPEEFSFVIARAKDEFLASLSPSARRQWTLWLKRGGETPGLFHRKEENEEAVPSGGGLFPSALIHTQGVHDDKTPFFFPSALIHTQGVHDDRTPFSKKQKDKSTSHRKLDGPGLRVQHKRKLPPSVAPPLSTADLHPEKDAATYQDLPAATSIAAISPDPQTPPPPAENQMNMRRADPDHKSLSDAVAAPTPGVEVATGKKSKRAVGASLSDSATRKKQRFRPRSNRDAQHPDAGTGTLRADAMTSSSVTTGNQNLAPSVPPT